MHPCLTAADIKAKGMSYGEKCHKMPEGWSESELHKVLIEGYSRAGIHNLNPSPSLYNAAGLLHIKDKMTPYLLDPSLEEFESMYAFGNGEAMGFYPSDELVAKRQKALEEQSARGEITATQKFEGTGGTKRPHRDSSTSSTASNSRQWKGQQSSSQTGGRLTYSKNHPNILSHENDGNKIRKVLNNRNDNFGQSVTGTVIKNGSDPLVIFSLLNLRGNSESKRNRPLNPQGDQSRSMVY